MDLNKLDSMFVNNPLAVYEGRNIKRGDHVKPEKGIHILTKIPALQYLP